jgi:O-antigen/teichoic acid export membrane protein
LALAGGSLKGNILANYLGQIWRALMAIAFVPVYIKFLGVEAYGLIGIFAILQAWFGLLDMGMKPALGREMARFTAGRLDAQSIRNLLRSVEIVGVTGAAVIALGIWATSRWLASDWVNAITLPVATVAKAFALMGVVVALRFIEEIYVSSIVGLQRQVLQNAVTSIMATMRGLGVVGILAFVSPTIEAFFIWQGSISLATVAVFAVVVHRSLPKSPGPARFSVTALLNIWRFAAGMLGITLLSLLLMQIDKIVLSRLLTLQAFGHYVLAGAVANALYMMIEPVTTAFYPRFTELLTRDDNVVLRAAYHQAAQMVTVMAGAAAIVLMVFGDKVLLLWTRNPELAREVRALMAVLVLGTLLNGLMWVPYRLQLADGWVSLSLRMNALSVVLLVPTILWIVPIYGPIGAAWLWVALNTSYLTLGIYFMHRRLLPTEKWRWYVQDIAIPLAAATAIAWLCRWAAPSGLGEFGEFGVLLISSGCVLAATILAAPMVRDQAFEFAKNKLFPIYS